MKSLLDWEVTIKLRPLRVLRAAAVVGAVVALCFLPTRQVGTASDRVHLTVTQLSEENAVKVVGDIVSARMAYLDKGRQLQLARTIVDESLSCGLDPLFLLAVGDVESRLDHEAVSPTGARGLFQVMPSTWDAEVRRRGLGRLEKFNVVHNAKVGIGYLCYMSTMFKRPDSLLLAYNQGPGGASAILSGKMTPSDEAATYSAKVWKSYRVLLAARWLPSDPKSMRQLYHNPDATIFTPFLGWNGDTHGPEARPPIRVKTSVLVTKVPQLHPPPKVESPRLSAAKAAPAIPHRGAAAWTSWARPEWL